MRLFRASVLFVFSCVMSNSTFADDGILYTGVSVGRGFAELPERHNYTQLARESDESTTFGLVIGDRISRFFAVELGYVDLGSYSYSNGNVEVEQESSAITLSFILRHQLRPAFAPYLKFGAYKGSTDYVATETGQASVSADASDAGAQFGIGADIRVMDRAFARIDWTIYKEVGAADSNEGRLKAIDISNVLLGVYFEF